MYCKLQLFIPPANEDQEDLKTCRDRPEGQTAHIMPGKHICPSNVNINILWEGMYT